MPATPASDVIVVAVEARRTTIAPSRTDPEEQIAVGDDHAIEPLLRDLREQHGIAIGETAVVNLARSALADLAPPTLDVRGRDLRAGHSRVVQCSTEFVRSSIARCAEPILAALVRRCEPTTRVQIIGTRALAEAVRHAAIARGIELTGDALS